MLNKIQTKNYKIKPFTIKCHQNASIFEKRLSDSNIFDAAKQRSGVLCQSTVHSLHELLHPQLSAMKESSLLY